MAKLNVYMWETDIGRFVAVATDVPTARTQVMAKLQLNDEARDELKDAIKGRPTVLGDKPLAFLAYEH